MSPSCFLKKLHVAQHSSVVDVECVVYHDCCLIERVTFLKVAGECLHIIDVDEFCFDTLSPYLHPHWQIVELMRLQVDSLFDRLVSLDLYLD